VIDALSMTVHQHVVEAAGRLVTGGLDRADAQFDAELLARCALGWTRAKFLSDRHVEALPEFTARYTQLVTRRLAREPVAYITGTREFWGLDFTVTPAVLIPRPETELLVEESLRVLEARPAAAADGRPLLAVDVGTGSGCVAISLASERPDLRVIATDISPAAISVARVNAERHHVDSRIEFRLGSFLEPVTVAPHLIVSNPPYVATTDILLPEVRDHEPAGALYAGPDGLDAIRALVNEATVTLRPGGFLVFEFALGQERAVRDLLAAPGVFRLDRIVADLQRVPRVVVAGRI
jgi:release factor glutamine methyltransferase